MFRVYRHLNACAWKRFNSDHDFIVFLKGKYTISPTILVTAEHHRAHLRHDAATVWLENVSARSFKICIRELQNFAGVHDDISVVSLYCKSRDNRLFYTNTLTFTYCTMSYSFLPFFNFTFAFSQSLQCIHRSLRSSETARAQYFVISSVALF